MATYRVGKDGKAPQGLKKGDNVVTDVGTYTINSVDSSGKYNSTLTDTSKTTRNYGSGAQPGDRIWEGGGNHDPLNRGSGSSSSGSGRSSGNSGSSLGTTPGATSYGSGGYYQADKYGKAPSGRSAGDNIVTDGGVWRIDAVNPDGTYQSSLVDRNTTRKNFTGTYADAGTTAGTAATRAYTPITPSDIDYDKENLSPADYERVQAFKNGYAYGQQLGGEEGQRIMDLNRQGAEAIRNANGYRTNPDGSGYIPIIQQYQMPEAPQYGGSQWDDVTNRAAQKLINMDYADWTQGDQYKALANRYGRQGLMSMQDVLGQVSSRTGGMASSYAATAAQQQYNDYMTRLEEAAMQMYDNERDNLRENVGVTNTLAKQDYDRYADQLAQYNTDRAFDYNVWNDFQQRLEDESDEAYTKEQAAKEQSYERNLNRAAQLMEYGIFDDTLAEMGWTQEEIEAAKRKYLEDLEYERAQDAWEQDYKDRELAALGGYRAGQLALGQERNQISWGNLGVAQQNAATSAYRASTAAANGSSNGTMTPKQRVELALKLYNEGAISESDLQKEMTAAGFSGAATTTSSSSSGNKKTSLAEDYYKKSSGTRHH